MSGEVSVVSAHLFLEKVSARCEHGHFTETFLLCVASLLYTFYIGYTQKQADLLSNAELRLRRLRRLKLLIN